MPPCIMCVQYIGDVQFIGGMFSISERTMSTSGDIMSTLGDVQYIGGYPSMSTLGDIMSTSGDIMMHVGDIMSTSAFSI